MTMIAVAERDDRRVVLVQVAPAYGRVWHRRSGTLFPLMSLDLLRRDVRWRDIAPGEGRELVAELRRGLAAGLVDDDAGDDPTGWMFSGSRRTWLQGAVST